MSSTPEESAPGLASDEELQKLTVGELKPHNAPITLAEYDPHWPSNSLVRPTGFTPCLARQPCALSTSARPPCLHVFSVGVSEIDRMLRFRDWLRATDADRDYYARTKRELARRQWRHVQHYADAKTVVIQEIMDRADLAAQHASPGGISAGRC